MNCNITYIAGNEEIVDDIQDLWKALNQYHLEKSCHFKQLFADFTFENRKKFFIEKAKNGKLHILVALHDGCKIGYCVSSVVNGTGEIDSMYVEPAYQNQQIGTTLVENSLKWIKENDVRKIIIGVASGNEESFDFYSKFGFVPKTTILQLVTD